MCIAVYLPIGKAKTVKDNTLWNCFEVNQDGIGYAFIDDKTDKLISKTFFKANATDMYYEFLPEFREDVEKNPKSPFILHFRASSAGTLGIDNCHPFKVSEDQVFIHNGTITAVKDDPLKVKSDTSMFNTEVMQQLPTNWTDFPVIHELIDEYIGASKLIFLNKDRSVNIIGEGRGHWFQGIWWSNKHYTGDWNRNAHGNVVYGIWNTGYTPHGNQNVNYNKNLSPSTNTIHCEWCDNIITNKNGAIWIDPDNAAHQVCGHPCKEEIEDMFGELTPSEKVDPSLITIYQNDSDVPLLESGMEH